MGGKKKKKELPAWTNQKHGEVAIPEQNVFNRLGKNKASQTGFQKMNEMDKKFRPSGDVKTKNKNVLGTLGKKKREPSGTKALFSGKVADAIDPSLLKVNPKHQKRTNKILGY